MLMTNNMMIVQRMADLKSFKSSHEMISGNIRVEYFTPYVRTTWEFRVDGVVIDRRYSPKSAAKFWVELHNKQD
jgi:hypothetical protein